MLNMTEKELDALAEQIMGSYIDPLEGSEPTFPTCTCVSKRGHWRKLRNGARHWFSDEICGDKAVWEAHNPLTAEVYYVCKNHWTDAALHTADRMGLKYRKVGDGQDAS